VAAQRGAGESEPGVQLVDVPVRVDARIVFPDARLVEQGGLTLVAGSRVDFHGVYDATIDDSNETRAADSRATRPPPLPRAAVGLVRAPRTRSAVAQDQRSVPHPRVRDHAAADAGRSGAAEVPRVA